MTIKKINLSALNKQDSKEVLENNAVLENNETIQNKTEVVEIVEKKEVEENFTKKKISLKSLKKCVITPSWEEICGDVESHLETKNEVSSEVIVDEIQNKQPKISLKKTSTLVEEVKNEEITEEKETILEVKSQEEKIEEKYEIFQISDWDTSCNIIKEEKSEIFANYKWSFLHSEEEVKNEVIKEVVLEEEKPLEAEVKETQIVSEKNTPETIQDKKEEKQAKTNLERYSESEKIAKKTKQKKLITWSIVWILALSASWFFATQNLFIKSNINEVQKVWVEVSTEKNIEPTIETSVVEENVEVKQVPSEVIQEVTPEIIPEVTQEVVTEVIPEVTQEQTNTPEIIVMPEMVNDIQTPENQNNQIVNNDIVKENDENQFDNIEKTTKINQKLHNYLREKYKK